MSQKGTVVVIGAGTAGNAAARSLAGSGWHVTQVERDRWGGTCLWRGCIPKKSLYRAAQVARVVAESEQYGVLVRDVAYDWPAALAWKWHAQTTYAGDQEGIARQRGIEVVRGSASFVSPTTITVEGRDIAADHFVIATGSEPVPLPVPGAQLTDGSEDALHYPTLPASIAIIGGGFIAFELAGVFASFGVRVTVLTNSERFLASLDEELVDVAIRHLSALGVRFHAGCTVTEVRGEPGALTVAATATNTDAIAVAAERVIAAIGRRPALADLSVDRAEVAVDERGRIVLDEALRTSNPRVWVVGDAAGGLMHTPVANVEGHAVARSITDGGAHAPDLFAMPATCFTVPQLATVGLTESQARDAGMEPKVVRIGLDSIGASIIDGDTDGLIKLVADGGTGKLLGAHIASPQASDLIYPAVVALKAGVTAEQLGTMVAVHPSHAELVYYAGG